MPLIGQKHQRLGDPTSSRSHLQSGATWWQLSKVAEIVNGDNWVWGRSSDARSLPRNGLILHWCCPTIEQLDQKNNEDMKTYLLKIQLPAITLLGLVFPPE